MLACSLAILCLGSPGVRLETPEVALSHEDLTQADLREFLKQRAGGEKAAPAAWRKSDPILAQARALEDQILLNAALWRLEGDEKAKMRALEALENTASVPMGGVEDVLGNAELIASMALGYDGLKDQMEPSQREALLKRIQTRGLEWSLEQESSKAFWTTNWRNSSVVIRSCMALAAALTHKDNLELSNQVLQSWRENVPKMQGYFGLNGGSSEGLVYWMFVLNYAALADEAVSKAKGEAFAPRVTDRADALYPVMLDGPSGKLYNFGDSIEDVVPAAALMFISKQQEKPAAAAWTREVLRDVISRPSAYTNAQLRFLPFALQWWNDAAGDDSALPLAKLYSGDDTVGVMRSSWSDPRAAFAAFVAGDRQASHSQIDLGSFIYEANGVRWAVDPGMDSGPGYFDAKPEGRRWQFFRPSAFGHSLLQVGGQAQSPKSSARVTRFGTGKNPFGIVDLSPSYGLSPGSYKRGFKLVGDSLLIQDEIPDSAFDSMWRMISEAEASNQNGSFVLRKDGQTLHVKFLGGGRRDSVIQQGPGKMQVGRSADSLLSLEFKVKAGTRRIAVLLTPDEGESQDLQPLSEW